MGEPGETAAHYSFGDFLTLTRWASISSMSSSSRRDSSVLASPCARRSSSIFAWMARVSRCSVRVMNSVIIQVASVAMAPQPNVPGDQINQAIEYKATIPNAAGCVIHTPTSVRKWRTRVSKILLSRTADVRRFAVSSLLIDLLQSSRRHRNQDPTEKVEYSAHEDIPSNDRSTCLSVSGHSRSAPG
jgi:hypothetical protein